MTDLDRGRRTADEAELLDDRDLGDDDTVEVTDAPETSETTLRRRRRRGRGGSLVVDLHNVTGLVAAVGIIVVSATGILLNHLEFFGVARPNAAVEQQRPPLRTTRSVDAIVGSAQEFELRSRGGESQPAELDRAVWSLGDGTVDVRLDGDPVVSVIVDAATAEPIGQVERHDLDVTAAHSGELIGKPWVILSDLVALVLIVSVVTGVIVWVRRIRSRRRLVGARGGPNWWIRANWWFHLVGGLAASVYLVVMSVTGILLNHKQPLGFMDRAPELAERAESFEPLAVPRMVEAAVTFRDSSGVGIVNVKSVDYRPKGYAKVRFDDDYEVIVDAADGSIERASRRWDVWIEDLHSGLLFGSKGWVLADIPAAIAIALTVNGVYLWTRPGWRARDRHAGRPGQ